MCKCGDPGGQDRKVRCETQLQGVNLSLIHI